MLVVSWLARFGSHTTGTTNTFKAKTWPVKGMLYWEMVKLVLLLVFCGLTCTEGDEATVEPPGPLETVSPCEQYTDMKRLAVTEGEALRIVPDGLKKITWNESQHSLFTWSLQKEHTNISSSEEERIHHHGPALFFLPLAINDTGVYIARLNFLGKCHVFYVPVLVVSASVALGKYRLYTPIQVSDSDPRIPCPEQVADLCKEFKGELSWYRNDSLMAGQKLCALRLQSATKADDGVYTCKCTWRHNGREYDSTASRELQVMEKVVYEEIQIVHPTATELTVHPGSPLEIKCVAFFGTNIKTGCQVWWEKNQSMSWMEGYLQTFSWEMEEPSKKSFFSATLTIYEVQESDLHTSFRCGATNHVETRYHTLSLKSTESRTYLVVALVCVAIVFLLAALAIKCFAVDLVLFSRRFLRCAKASNDGLRYDVYVVHHHSQGESELLLDRFLSQALPLVLEQKCGYRVLVHGRDDTTREDRLEQIVDRVRLSRRLMVVLTPGSEVNQTLGSSHSSPVGVDVDWQVGLRQALDQEMGVILVQLGEVGPQGYTHLCPTLQRLLQKHVPLYWREDLSDAAHWNSPFWKRVRCAMPMTSAKSYSSSV